MQKFGYVRVSTLDQNTDRQYSALIQEGIEEKNIFEDKLSGKDFDRPAYKRLLEQLEEGDLLVVKSVDRLGRNYHDVIDQWRYLIYEKKINISIIDMPIIDTNNKGAGITGELINSIILQLLSYVAQIERDFLLQRQKEGIVEAKKKGIKFGRPIKPKPDNFLKVKNKYDEKHINSRDAAEILEVSHTTFLKWIKE